MAIDFPGSPTNGQTFTSGSVTYTWDGTKWTAVASGGGGGGATDKIEEGNTSAEVVDTGSDGRFVVNTDGVEALRVDNQQRVGIGTASASSKLHVNGANGDGLTVSGGGATGVMRSSAAGTEIGNTSGDNTVLLSGAGVERMRIDTSGRLLVGTSSARSNVYWYGTNITPPAQFEASGSAYGGISLITYSASNYSPLLTLGTSGSDTPGTNTAVGSGNQLGAIHFAGNDGSNFRSGAIITGTTDAAWGSGSFPTRLVFSTTADGASSPTERMRISRDGFTSIRSVIGGCVAFLVSGTANSSDTLLSGFHSSSNISSGTASIRVRTNGNVENTNNSYGALSDAKLKENIVAANSQWDDLKALQVRNYNFKVETGQQTHTQLGLIAQEVELVSPGLVTESPDRETVQIPILDENGDPVLDENGDPTFTTEERETGTVTKSVNYSVLYMKAVKALQEAMERIETLEAKVAALENPTV